MHSGDVGWWVGSGRAGCSGLGRVGWPGLGRVLIVIVAWVHVVVMINHDKI